MGRARKQLAQLGLVIVAVAVIVTVLTFFARLHPRIELLTHFKLQLTLGVLLAAALLAVARSWKGLAAAALLLVWHVPGIAAFYWPASGGSDGPGVRVLYANVYVGNRDHQLFRDLIRNEQPDVIVLSEFSESWQRALLTELEDYPHRVLDLRDDPFSIALLSKLPIVQREVHLAVSTGFPTVSAAIEVNRKRLTIIGTHPPPPGGGAPSLRDRQMAEVAEFVSQSPRPLLLVGDLNCTSWSPVFVDFLKTSGVRDGCMGFGVQPSWPDFPAPLRIPIDHTLISEGVRVTNRRLGPDIGSDHRPVIVDVTVE